MRASQYRYNFGTGRSYRAAGPDKLLSFIIDYQIENGGISPSFSEMQRALGAQSKSSVHRAMQHLISERRIRVLPGRARAIEVVSETIPGVRPELPPPFLDTRGWKAFVVEHDPDGWAYLVPMEPKP